MLLAQDSNQLSSLDTLAWFLGAEEGEEKESGFSSPSSPPGNEAIVLPGQVDCTECVT